MPRSRGSSARGCYATSKPRGTTRRMWAPRGRLQGELAAHQQPQRHGAQQALSGTTALVEASHGAKEPYLRSQLPIARAGAHLETILEAEEMALEAAEEAVEAAEEAVEEVEEAAEEAVEEAAEEDLSSEASGI